MAATDETMTRAEFAARHCKSRMAVSKWERRGLLQVVAGRVHVAISEARMRGAGVESAALTASEGPGGAVDPDAPELEQFLGDLAAGNWATQTEADRVKANALAGLRVLQWRKEAGELVELEAAQTVLFEGARGFRDALMGWPSQVGPLIAADLDVPAERTIEILDQHVRALLSGLGDPNAGDLIKN